MSVLLRGMEMPKNGSCIQIVIDDDGEVYPSVEKCILKMGSIAKAVPVQPHGDLIDRDYLKQTHCAECTLYPSNCLEKSGEECDWESIAHLNMCPVVIPAEDGET